MNPRTKRTILRAIHFIFAIPVLGYIYSPYKLLPSYAFVARYIAVPVLTLAGFWMWIGSTPKKAILLPVGVFLILLGIVAPLPLAPAAQAMPPGTLRTISNLAVDLFRLSLVAGLVCAIVGARRNRRLGQLRTTDSAL